MKYVLQQDYGSCKAMWAVLSHFYFILEIGHYDYFSYIAVMLKTNRTKTKGLYKNIFRDEISEIWNIYDTV